MSIRSELFPAMVQTYNECFTKYLRQMNPLIFYQLFTWSTGVFFYHNWYGWTWKRIKRTLPIKLPFNTKVIMYGPTLCSHNGEVRSQWSVHYIGHNTRCWDPDGSMFSHVEAFVVEGILSEKIQGRRVSIYSNQRRTFSGSDTEYLLSAEGEIE